MDCRAVQNMEIIFLLRVYYVKGEQKLKYISQLLQLYRELFGLCVKKDSN